MPTRIEWTQGDDGASGETWNVVRGCSRVSPGCGGAKGKGGCYAERQAIRQSGPGGAYEGLVRSGPQGPRWTGKVKFVAEKLLEPLHWKKSRRVFVNSMSDLFHEKLTNEEIAAVYGVMAAAKWHTFQILTKRSTRAREWYEWIEAEAKKAGISPSQVCVKEACNRALEGHRLHVLGDEAVWPLPNVWMGVSVETQEYADERVPDLLLCAAAIRFVSYEPALGPVDFNRAAWGEGRPRPSLNLQARQIDPRGFSGAWDSGFTPMRALDWIIVGGESGPGAREFAVAWARAVVSACKDANVACFVKQLGCRPVLQSETSLFEIPLVLSKRKGNDMEEWPLDLRVRQFPAMAEAAS